MWYFLADKGLANYNTSVIDNSELSNWIINSLHAKSVNLEWLRGQQLEFILSSDHISWITEDRRLNHWLSKQLCEKMGIIFFKHPELTWRESAIALLDRWTSSTKILATNKLKFEWEELKKLDKKLDWMKGPDGQEKLQTAWAWIVKNRPYNTTLKSTPTSIPALIEFFDDTFLHNADREICIAAIRKRWSQHAYRKKQENKKQYNFILTDSAVKRLDSFCKKYDLSRAHILEILLQAEQERNGQSIEEKIKIYKGAEL
ncbi:hypothetical protein IB260_05890 [Pseudomonas sp. PDM23]|uniref:hypothetical protein n=1 Tax=Pseudomonas sp. PDM23 TaxID=2769275 RepID=UPI0017834733|nr:hypothetical protein [Pseudomonas sp. PDM23]MBD9574834.1 hypothetical protein [Pseudomonas sp. PDM23]